MRNNTLASLDVRHVESRINPDTWSGIYLRPYSAPSLTPNYSQLFLLELCTKDLEGLPTNLAPVYAESLWPYGHHEITISCSMERRSILATDPHQTIQHKYISVIPISTCLWKTHQPPFGTNPLVHIVYYVPSITWSVHSPIANTGSWFSGIILP